MKPAAFITLFMALPILIFAQVETSQSELSRVEKRAIKKTLRMERKAEVSEMITNNDIVIDIDRFGVTGPTFGRSIKNTEIGPRQWIGLVGSEDYQFRVCQDKVYLKTGLAHQSHFPEDKGANLEGKIRNLEVTPFRNFTRLRFAFSTDWGQHYFEGRITNEGEASGRIKSLSNRTTMYFEGSLPGL